MKQSKRSWTNFDDNGIEAWFAKEYLGIEDHETTNRKQWDIASIEEDLMRDTYEVKGEFVKSWKSGNIFIDTSQAPMADLTDRQESGISTSTATYWVHILHDEDRIYQPFIFRTKELLDYVRKHGKPIVSKHRETSWMQCWGMLLPIKDLHKIAIRHKGDEFKYYFNK